MRAPSEWFTEIRKALAGPGQSPEWVAFSIWWGGLKRHQRRAWFTMAGVPETMPTAKAWGELPAKYRAALVVVVNSTRLELAGIASASERAAPSAVAMLQKVAA